MHRCCGRAYHRGPEGAGQCVSAFGDGMPGVTFCSGIGGKGKWGGGGPEQVHHEVSWILLKELFVECTVWALEPDCTGSNPGDC